MDLFIILTSLASLFGVTLGNIPSLTETRQTEAALTAHHQIINRIAERCNSHIRPVLDDRTATNVTIGIALHRLIALDSTEQTLTTNIWMRVRYVARRFQMG